MIGPDPLTDESQVRVFLSYSRKDIDRAEQLREQLHSAGFGAYLDRRDILPGEPWQERLARLIEMADTVLFLLSPDSVASSHCDWEVNEAERLFKRILPVVIREVPETAVPGRLKRLNYVFLRDQVEAVEGFARLTAALMMDVAWIREHTRLGGLAADWFRRDQAPNQQLSGDARSAADGKASDLLLRGEALSTAERWLSQPQAGGQAANDLQRAFISTSRDAETARLAKEREQVARTRRIQRRFTWGLSSAAVIVVASMAWIVVQTRTVSEQTSLVLASAADAASNQARFDQGVRLAVLATKGNWLQPSHATAKAALVRAVDSSTLRLMLTESSDQHSFAHARGVTTASFSPDGGRIVTASLDGTARVWNAITGMPIGAPVSHSGPIVSARFSPSGEFIVTGSEDKTARVWRAETGEPVGSVMRHNAGVTSARFSPDGARVLTAASAAHLWDAKTGDTIGRPMRHLGRFEPSFSRDGSRVVTASQLQSVQLWNAETTDPAGAPLRHDGDIRSARFSPGDAYVITASQTPTYLALDAASRSQTRFWDPATGSQVGEPTSHVGVVYIVSVSDDGTRILTTEGASGSNASSTRVWDAVTRQPIGEPMTQREHVREARFAPDGKRVVTASDDGSARVWDSSTGKTVGDARTMTHAARVLSADFSPDGKRLVTASEDRTVRVWDTEVTRVVGGPLIQGGAHAYPSPDGKSVVTAALDTIRFWDVESGKLIGQPQKSAAVLCAAFTPNGERFIAALADRTIRRWDTLAKPINAPVRIDGWPSSPTCLGHAGERVVTSVEDPTVFRWDSSSDSTVASASPDRIAQIWNAATGQPVGRPLRHAERINSAGFSHDDKRVVTASADNTASIWDAATGERVGIPMPHDGQVVMADFSRDGKHVVTASLDGKARVWNAETGESTGWPLIHGGPLTSAQFSANGKLIVTASKDRTARVWDAASGKPVSAPMLHGGVVYSASFSPGGERIVSAGVDEIEVISDREDGKLVVRRQQNIARVWDAYTGKPLSEPLPHSGHVRAADFSRDGRRIFAASDDGTARIWNLHWSTIDGAEALLAAVCARMNSPARRITNDDRHLAPLIPPDQLGRDVCDGVIAPPPQ